MIHWIVFRTGGRSLGSLKTFPKTDNSCCNSTVWTLVKSGLVFVVSGFIPAFPTSQNKGSAATTAFLFINAVGATIFRAKVGSPFIVTTSSPVCRPSLILPN
ncbi:hypothetical protein V8G54_035395 [Vigna mungo]|uniref:Uncharacterized protein n=1 Tax=Vigna mungo TaxID=3915 RepID=A0AAQ3MEX5_VIGMU